MLRLLPALLILCYSERPLNPTSTPTERSGTQRKALSPISSFLNVPPMRKNARGDKFSAACVVTSEQCLAMIEEKE